MESGYCLSNYLPSLRAQNFVFMRFCFSHWYFLLHILINSCDVRRWTLIHVYMYAYLIGCLRFLKPSQPRHSARGGRFAARLASGRFDFGWCVWIPLVFRKWNGKNSATHCESAIYRNYLRFIFRVINFIIIVSQKKEKIIVSLWKRRGWTYSMPLGPIYLLREKKADRFVNLFGHIKFAISSVTSEPAS